MKTQVKIWLHNLAAAVITGFSSTALASLGIGAANAVGVKVETLDYRQLLSVAVAGGLVGLLAYLKQSPLPPDE